MADNTRFKELNARVDKMMEAIQTQAHTQQGTNAVLETTGSRLDRLESMLEKLLLNVAQHQAQPSSSSHPAHDREGHPHSSPFGHPRAIKLDFPRFLGGDALDWIYKAKRFFKIYDIPEEQRVDIASVHLEGKALPWFQMLEKANQVPNWFALSNVIQIQFGPSILRILELNC